MVPHGFTDSEWAKMKVKTLKDVTREKVRMVKGADDAETKRVEKIAAPEEEPIALAVAPRKKRKYTKRK